MHVPILAANVFGEIGQLLVSPKLLELAPVKARLLMLTVRSLIHYGDGLLWRRSPDQLIAKGHTGRRKAHCRAVTVPVTVSDWGLPLALSVNINVAVRVPAAVGANVRLTVQVPEGAMEAPQFGMGWWKP